MVGNKPAIYSDLVKVDGTTDDEIARQIADDADTAPELADDWFDKADLHYGETLLRRGRGRRQLEAPKERPTHLGGKPNLILRFALLEEPQAAENLADAIRRLAEPHGGFELPAFPRGPMRDPPDFR